MFRFGRPLEDKFACSRFAHSASSAWSRHSPGPGVPAGSSLLPPGPVTSALSLTPHRLIRDAQAALVTNAHDVLVELGPLGVLQPPLLDPETRLTDDLDPGELRVREAFPARRAISVDELGLLVGIRVGECLAVLGSLAARGHVEALGDGTWRLVRKR